MILQRLFIIGILSIFFYSSGHAQIASFNFSATPVAVTGWTNLSGNPAASVVTATSNGITVSSIAAANWAPNGGVSARNGNGFNPGTYFPAAVMSNNWFQYNGTTRTLANYNASVPQLQISGLNPDSFYILKMSGSDTSSLVSNPMDYIVSGSIVNSAQGLNAHNNATQGITFQGIFPNSSGVITIYVNTTSSTDIASICGLQVWSGTSTVGIPAVTITSPANNAVFAQGSNVLIAATVTEAGGTIAKVQFYYATTFIGEVDTPPYNFTWIDPAAGSYNLAVKATDNAGTITVVKSNITVEPATNYWSTLGNSGNNASTNFIGNVDSVRLALRAKNIEWLSVLPTGNVGIGVIAPTAQLHTTGSVRLAGLTSSGTATRTLVSDSLGNLFYSTSAGSGGHWLTSGGTYYDSTDNIAIGTSNPQGYKLAVNGNAIFTKIVVKPETLWPDYVFDKDYRLPSLEDLRKYIDRYKHLPGMTDAVQADSVGIDVAATQSVLLKKLEELTLYMIRQNAAIEELKRSNRMLQRKIRNLENKK
jgi:hypothetical protein